MSAKCLIKPIETIINIIGNQKIVSIIKIILNIPEINSDNKKFNDICQDTQLKIQKNKYDNKYKNNFKYLPEFNSNNGSPFSPIVNLLLPSIE